MTRFCAACGGDVEISDGYCLLGHSIKEIPPLGSLAELRQEVEKAFDDAQVELAAILPAPAEMGAPPSRELEQVSVGGAAGAPPAPPAPSPFADAPLTDSGWSDPSDPIAAFAPPPRMDWGPRKGFLRRRTEHF